MKSDTYRRTMRAQEPFMVDSIASTESGNLEESFDEVQAVKSALSFLCRINADYKQVEKFLTKYPEALLFEGIQMDDSVQCIVEEQMRHCECFVQACNENRRKILALLKRGFEYYRGVMFVQSSDDDSFLRTMSGGSNWQFYSSQLRALERDLREIRRNHLAVRSSIVESRSEVKAMRLQLEGASRKENTSRSALSLLKCQRNTHIFEKRSVLENKLRTATLSIASLEKEEELLTQEKFAAKQLHTALLRNAFASCQRHVCEATRRDFDETEALPFIG
jgi:histidyl-tRNA synthetase